jgi:formylglycine-generating enzyme
MAGNAGEWVHDFYERTDDGYGYAGKAQVNPKGPSYGAYGHVVRGGSYRDPAFWLRNAARHASIFATRDIGFRCAYGL